MQYLFSSIIIIASCFLMDCYEHTNNKHFDTYRKPIKIDKSSISLSNVNKDNFLSIANFSMNDYLINIEYHCDNKYKQKYQSLLISKPALRLNPNSVTSVSISLIDILTDDIVIHNNTKLIIKAIKLGKYSHQNREYEKIEIPIVWI